MTDVRIIKDNSDEFGEQMRAAVLRGLEKIGLVAEGYAKRLCPVDTGRLRNSITHVIDNDEPAAYIGTNVEYGPYVELGTSRQRAHPFLTPAASDHGAEYRDVLESELRGK